METDECIRQMCKQLDELDYTELYKAYSGKIRRTQVDPKIMFKLLVCAYALDCRSTRKIESLCRSYVPLIQILDGKSAPDHTTICRFRSGEKTGEAIINLCDQYIMYLEKIGETDHKVVFLDGTKMESMASRHSYVWRKRVVHEINKAKDRLKELLKDKQEGYTTLGKAKEYLENLEKQIKETGIPEEKLKRGCRKPEIIRLRDEVKKLVEKWENNETKLKIMGEDRNSYSKTDPDATFMHPKDDPTNKGPLRAEYNVQFAVNSQYITGISLFSNPADCQTMPEMLNLMYKKQGKKYGKVSTDSGYESLSNYLYLQANGQQAAIKPRNFELLKTKKFKAQIGRVENMTYKADGDYYVCANDKKLTFAVTKTEKLQDGTSYDVKIYRCEDCVGCKYRDKCCKAKDKEKPKEVTVCEEFAHLRQQSVNLLMSEEGKLLRVNRSIQSEGSFGQMKWNHEFRRFLMCGKRKITIELSLWALAQNGFKYIRKCASGKQQTHLWEPKELAKS